MANGKDVVQAMIDFALRNGWKEEYEFGEPRTRQEFAQDADINHIMKNYERTGALPGPYGEPMYVDFTALPGDLMGTIAYLDQADEAFMRLPAIVRKEFDNDPVRFVEFASNPGNLDKMREWQLAPPAAVVEPAPSAASPAPAPAGAPSAGASTQ